MSRWSFWKLAPLTVAVAVSAAALAALPASSARASTKGKVYKIGMVSAGDVTDHGYYETLADRVRNFAKSHGWPKPIIVPRWTASIPT
jgi:ABC-type sugar transport system substrate-binding protein